MTRILNGIFTLMRPPQLTAAGLLVKQNTALASSIASDSIPSFLHCCYKLMLVACLAILQKSAELVSVQLLSMDGLQSRGLE